MQHMLKKVEEGVRMLRREKESLKKGKIELLIMKSTVFEMKTQNFYGDYHFCHYF